MLLKYLKYVFTAKHKNGHGIHSPFIFNLLTQVIENKLSYYAYEEIEQQRLKMSENNSVIEIDDYGAGSRKMGKRRKISAIVKNSSTNAKFGELLFRLVNFFQPKTILELGTCLGIGTLYLSKAAAKAKIYSIEADRTLHNIAGMTLKDMKVNNCSLINATFEAGIDLALQDVDSLDFVFFDANHQYLPTMQNFEKCLVKSHENTVFVFDDIHWSDGMERAWNEIKSNSAVKVTIDLFQFGIVLFRKELQKQHYIIKF